MGASPLRVDNVLVILACTLAGSIQRDAWIPARFINVSSSNQTSRTPPKGSRTCAGGVGQWRDCVELDATIHAVHLCTPWCCALSTVVALGLPTVLLRSKTKEKGLCLFTGILIQYLGLHGSALLMSGHPTMCFVFSLHACVRFLLSIEATHVLVGGGGWWSLRYVSVLAMLLTQLVFGPAVAVVQWPGATVETGVSCAYLCHLVGCIAPDMVLSGIRCLAAFGRFVHIRDDS
jgi:hypothetical protein